MKFLVCSKLSEHRYKTPEGYLVCVDSILSRTGKQTYSRDELFHDGCQDDVEVDRSAEEVFSDKTLASFENKPLTIEHPDEDVTPKNHNKYAVGFIRDIKRGKDGQDDVMLGTIVVTDAEAIELVETGKLKELSCGYDCDIEDEDNPQQRNIRGNHVALCEKGRAGIARIVDSVKDEVLKRGKTYVAASGAKLTVDDIEAGYSDYNGEPFMTIYYSYVSASGRRKGKSKCSSRDFWSMMTDKSKTGDSIKDEQLYAVEFSYDGDSWSDYLGHVNVRAKSEQEALTKAKRWASEHYDNPGFFKIASTKYTNVETIDVIKDAMFEICYIDNGDVCVAIEAKDENDARQKFHRRYGMYYIKHIRKVKDGVKDMTNIDDRLIEIPEDRLKRFEEQLKMRKIHVVSRGRTMMGRIHYQVEFGGSAKQLAKLLNELDDIMDRQNIPMTYSAGDNGNDYSTAGIDLDKMYVKDCKDEAPIYAVKARYNGTVLEWYVRANSEQEAFDKVKRQPGHNYDKFVSAKIVKERAGMHIIDEDPYEESTKGLEEAEKNLHDKMICNTGTDCKDADESIVYKGIKIDVYKGLYGQSVIVHAPNGNFKYSSIETAKRDIDKKDKELFDSTKDAKTEYVFNYQDTYHRTRDKMRVDANNLDEAIREFGKTMALGGYGTANIYVISVSPNDGYIRAYGKLSEMLKQKWTRDSAKTLDSKKLYSIVKVVKSIKSKDAKETKLTFAATNDFANVDMTNAMIGKLVSSGIDYHSARKNAGKYSVVILGGDDVVRKAKLVIENIGFFSKWS